VGYKSRIRRRRKGDQTFQNWLIDYAKNNPLKSISSTSAFIGFIIYMAYSWNIEFLAFPDTTDSLFFLGALSLIGSMILLMIVTLFIIPGILWKTTEAPKDWHFIGVHFICVYILLYAIGSGYRSWCLLFLPLLVFGIFVYKKCLGKYCVKSYLAALYFTFFTFAISIFIFWISLKLFIYERGDFSLGGSLNVTLAFIVVVLMFFVYTFNSLVVSVQKKEHYIIPPFIVLCSILILSPSFLPKSVMRVTKIGSFKADILFTDKGKKIYKKAFFCADGKAITNKDDFKGKKDYSVASNVQILSRVGKEVLFELPACKEETNKEPRRLLIDKKYISGITPHSMKNKEIK